MPMIDISNMYRKSGSRKPFNRFMESSSFSRPYDYLRKTARLPEDQVIIRQHPHRGNPATVLVHPLIAFEFVRWLDYGKYAAHVESKMV